MTDTPAWVSSFIFLGCRAPSEDELAGDREKYGPHAFGEVHIYMNPSAAEAFPQSDGEYPPGSIIVKEKLGITTWGSEKLQKDLPETSVGGMIKRAAGYEPANNDWEYFYYENPKNIESGKLPACINCHRSVLEKDCVFGNWAKSFEFDLPNKPQ